MTSVRIAGEVDQDEGQVAFATLPWVGPLAVVTAVAANLIMPAAVGMLTDILSDHEPLSLGSVIFASALGATAVFAAIGRLARRPIPCFGSSR